MISFKNVEKATIKDHYFANILKVNCQTMLIKLTNLKGNKLGLIEKNL